MATESEILSKLDLGASKAILNNEPQSALGQLLLSISNDIIKQLQGKLSEYNINTSSQALSQSIVALPTVVEGDTVTVKTNAEFYWKYINYGVNGTMVSHGAPSHGSAPPGELSFSESIGQWIQQRGLQLPPQFDSFEAFNYVIRKKIIEEGKEARPFYSDVVNKALIANIKMQIERVTGKAMKVRIVAPWQQNTK